MSNEIWKDVVGYEGIYEVSNHGRVRTHAEKMTWSSRHKTWRHWKQRYLKDKTPNGRDVRVALWKDGKVKDFLVHRLVAYAFIPMIEGKDCINHIDGNPKNNNVENLEWCNHLENNRHAFDKGLIKSQIKVKLQNTKTLETRKFDSMTKASQFLQRSHNYVSSKIKKNKNIVEHKNGDTFLIRKAI